jgi:hypothetical protein
VKGTKITKAWQWLRIEMQWMRFASYWQRHPNPKISLNDLSLSGRRALKEGGQSEMGESTRSLPKQDLDISREDRNGLDSETGEF